MVKYKILKSCDLNDEKIINYLFNLNYLRWLQNNDAWLNNLTIIVAIKNNKIVGHLSLIKQPLTVPVYNETLKIANKIIMELFVQTFHVSELYRRLGIGLSLQELALTETKSQNCYQLRSWSSFDKKGNYQLKLKLGFSFAPSFIESNGKKIAGGYFIKTV
ncbi:GNAT family N-acetyltransferase [Clostridium sp. 'deep sea']|uniref:GNAT family N-acetyltransferase n=1 Tax=Clostridium sp. 'deep sea' TaxID=2779445 RepID=UPI001896699B|nr:GNAT family N-acetyltransferase [Clostridium sp. 'deep sea']QOR34119.1 GNAT family N-acetyltransferase [Clostridium sp. 'deep sea']